MGSETSGRHRSLPLRWDVRGLALALLVIAVLQVIVIVAGDSRFSSGSDAGGRAAAVAAAVENGGCDHDLGYWAAEADPQGAHHPLTRSDRTSDRYVQPTDVLYVCAAAGTAGLLGSPFALLISVVGVLMAAAGAWFLDRSSGGSGWLALALVGGVGSIAFYGGDTWEHAPAAGAAVLGTALLLNGGGYVAGVAGGVLWGVAVSFRLETGIVAVALAVVLLLTPSLRTALVRSWPRQVAFAVCAASVVVVDRVVERSVLSSAVRDARVVGEGGAGGGQVGSAASDVGQRARDVLVTNVGVRADDADVLAFVVGATFCIALVVLAVDAVGGRLPSARIRNGAALVVVAVVALLVADRGFVPGMLVAAPVAAVGLVVAVGAGPVGPLPTALARAALLALPVVWFFQWTGNLTAQWGGRYQLVSAAFLTIAGVAALRGSVGTTSGRVVVGAAVAVGMLGLAWHVERTTLMADVFDELADVPCDEALVSAEEFFLREGGGTTAVQEQQLGSCRLLTANPATVPRALEVAADMGARRATVLYRGKGTVDPARFEPWTVESTSTDDLGRIPVTVVQLRL